MQTGTQTLSQNGTAGDIYHCSVLSTFANTVSLYEKS